MTAGNREKGIGNRVKWISYDEVRDQPELLAEYSAECAHPVLGVPNPHWESYALLQASGMMLVFGVYQLEVMVGFAVLLVTVQPHYSVKVATVESLFVQKAQRGSGAGAELMRAIEWQARHEKCRAIVYGAMAGGELEAVLGKRYPRAGSSFCKPLG